MAFGKKLLLIFIFLIPLVTALDWNDELRLYLPFSSIINDFSGDDINTTFNPLSEYDIEVAWANITYTYFNNPANCVDENWTTYGHFNAATPAALYGVLLYENYSTYSGNDANFTLKYSLSGSGTCDGRYYNVSCYNGSDWVNIYLNTSKVSQYTLTVPLNEKCYDGDNPIQIRSDMRAGTTASGDCGVSYYEGKVNYNSNPNFTTDKNNNFFNTTNLSSRYEFKTGNSNDLQGTNNGVDTNITYSSSGANFNGTDSVIDMGDVLDIRANNITICTWIKPTEIDSSWDFIMGKGDNTGTDGRYGLGIYDNKAQMYFDYGTSTACNSAAGTIQTNTLYFLCGSIDRNNSVKIYINGVVNNTCTFDEGNIADYDIAIEFHLGEYGGSGYYYNGSMKNVYVYNRALTSIEINELYNNPGAILLNGVDEYVEIDNTSSLSLGSGDDLTISMWLNASPSSSNRELIVKGTNAANWGFNLDGADKIYLFNGANRFPQTNVLITEDVWQHYVFTVNNSNFTIYQNGTFKTYGSYGFGTENVENIYLGENTHYNIPFNGSIDEVRLYNRSLADWEIENLYNAFNDFNLNVTSNITDYSYYVSTDFNVDIDYTGFSGTVNCTVESNSSNLTCTNVVGVGGTVTSVCDITMSYVNQIVNLKPYCTNGTKIYSESHDLTLGYNATINITLFDADSLEKITLENITIDLYNEDANYSNSTHTDNNTGSAYMTDLPYGTMRFTFYSTNYDTNIIYYDLDLGVLIHNLSLYLTNTTSLDIKDVMLNVRDDTNSDLEGALISIFAQNTTSGNFYLVSKAYTNINGQKLVQLVKDNVWYSFTIEYEGSTCYITENPFTITASDDNIYFLCVVEDNYVDIRDAYNDVNTTLTAVNTSNTTGYFTYVGVSAITTDFCLDIYRTIDQTQVLENHTCSNATSTIITINVNSSSYNDDVTYEAFGSYLPLGQTIYTAGSYANLLFRLLTPITLGNTGLYVTLLVMILFFFVNIETPKVAVIGAGAVYFFATVISNITRFKLIDIPHLSHSSGTILLGSGVLVLMIAIIISFSLSKEGGE